MNRTKKLTKLEFRYLHGILQKKTDTDFDSKSVFGNQLNWSDDTGGLRWDANAKAKVFFKFAQWSERKKRTILIFFQFYLSLTRAKMS